jgi:hypothetical protein
MAHDQIVETCFSISRYIGGVKENPLARLLRPDGRDEREREQLTVPGERQDPLLRLLATYPDNFKADFLELPARNGFQLHRINMLSGRKSYVKKWFQQTTVVELNKIFYGLKG